MDCARISLGVGHRAKQEPARWGQASFAWPFFEVAIPRNEKGGAASCFFMTTPTSSGFILARLNLCTQNGSFQQITLASVGNFLFRYGCK